MNCGTYQILSEVVIDYYTTNSDFSADVMSRAQFYSENLNWYSINDCKLLLVTIFILFDYEEFLFYLNCRWIKWDPVGPFYLVLYLAVISKVNAWFDCHEPGQIKPIWSKFTGTVSVAESKTVLKRPFHARIYQMNRFCYSFQKRVIFDIINNEIILKIK